MQRLTYAVSIFFFCTATGIGFADDATTTSQKPEQEIRKLLTEMEESFNRQDAKALAACWTPQGDFVGQEGERIEGRDNIEKGFVESLAARKDSRLRLLVQSLRVIGENFAVVDAIAAIKPQATITAGKPAFQLVLVKRDKRWLIESARETITHAGHQSQPLKGLEWLVGDWAGENGQASAVSIRSSCDWSMGGAYLVRKFSAERKGDLVRGGTEVIGWDPRTHRIRSWMFDSDGSFGESVWTRDGDRWIVKHTGTLADGSDAAVTLVVTCVDANTVTVQSEDHIVNGEKQSDPPEITLKRQPPKEPAAARPGESQKQSERILP